MKHAIILPLKESYYKKNAGAVAIWVKDYLKNSNIKKKIFVFTSSKKNTNLFSKKNVISIKKSFNLLTNYNYISNISNILKKKKFTSVEIHNRPEYAKFIILNNPDIKVNLVFHNNPNSIRSSDTIDKKIFLLNNCENIIFVSKFVKTCFFKNLKINHKNNTHIIYNSIDKLKNFPNKKKLIVFCGKLNKSKGYPIFGESVIKILNLYPDWKAIVVGNEPREKYNFKHSKLKIIDWLPNKDILKIYEKAAISVVNPLWQEPFGRTAMESASRGCAVITSYSGGLQETFKNNLILKINSEKHLTALIKKLINNPANLKKIQRENFINVKHNIKLTSKKLDLMVINTNSNELKINYLANKNKRILHISTFGEKLDYRTFNISISKKITNGFIRNGHDVINFDYRENKNTFQSKLDDKIINIANHYKPDLIMFGHNNLLKRSTLQKLKKNNECKLSIWYEDHVVKGDPSYRSNLDLLEKNSDLIDNYFISTHPSKIITCIKRDKLNFLPIPVDPSIEFGEFYNIKKTKDLFFALSHGVNYGKLKANTTDERYNFIDKLVKSNHDLSFNILGLFNEEPKWNFNFLEQLSICKTALNLSRGGPNKYATSNRLGTLAGNGCAVLIDQNVKYQDFFSDKEMFFYTNLDHLSNNLLSLCSDDNKLLNMGKRLKKRYFEIFSNDIIADNIIYKNFNFSKYKKYAWE